MVASRGNSQSIVFKQMSPQKGYDLLLKNGKKWLLRESNTYGMLTVDYYNAEKFRFDSIRFALTAKGWEQVGANEKVFYSLLKKTLTAENATKYLSSFLTGLRVLGLDASSRLDPVKPSQYSTLDLFSGVGSAAVSNKAKEMRRAGIEVLMNTRVPSIVHAFPPPAAPVMWAAPALTQLSSSAAADDRKKTDAKTDAKTNVTEARVEEAVWSADAAECKRAEPSVLPIGGCSAIWRSYLTHKFRDLQDEAPYRHEMTEILRSGKFFDPLKAKVKSPMEEFAEQQKCVLASALK